MKKDITESLTESLIFLQGLGNAIKLIEFNGFNRRDFRHDI